MKPPSNNSWSKFSLAVISGGASFVVTLTTIVGFGWKMHREIMNDVATMQAQSISLLEKTLIDKIGTKMDSQPSSYQLQLQDTELKGLKTQVENTNLRIGAMETQLKEIKSIVTTKR